MLIIYFVNTFYLLFRMRVAAGMGEENEQRQQKYEYK